MTVNGFDPARVARVVAALAEGERDPRRTLCAASADVVGVSGAGVVLLSRQRTLGNVCVSDPVIQTVEDVQYVLGEGPCVDAFNTRTPVLVADLAADARWPEFRLGAFAAGMQAAFGFPLLVGPSCIGALNLFNDHPGALSDEQRADTLAVAHVAGRTVLGWQATAEPGLLPWQLEHVPITAPPCIRPRAWSPCRPTCGRRCDGAAPRLRVCRGSPHQRGRRRRRRRPAALRLSG